MVHISKMLTRFFALKEVNGGFNFCCLLEVRHKSQNNIELLSRGIVPQDVFSE